MGISPRQPPASKTPPRHPAAERVTLSFRYFRERAPFVTLNVGGNYAGVLLERLSAVCAMTVKEMKESRGKPLRCHPIRFEETSEAGGFEHIKFGLIETTEPYQFSLTSNKHGRVHGFFVGTVFYVVWVDPTHALYPKKG